MMVRSLQDLDWRFDLYTVVVRFRSANKENLVREFEHKGHALNFYRMVSNRWFGVSGMEFKGLSVDDITAV